MKKATGLHNEAIAILNKYADVKIVSDVQGEIESDVKILVKKYTLADIQAQKLTNLLSSSVSKAKGIAISNKVDLVTLHSIVLRLGLSVSADMADFDNNQFNIQKLLQLLKKDARLVPKEESPFKQARRELEKLGKKIDVASLAKLAKSSMEDAEKYYKKMLRGQSMGNARKAK